MDGDRREDAIPMPSKIQAGRLGEGGKRRGDRGREGVAPGRVFPGPIGEGDVMEGAEELDQSRTPSEVGTFPAEEVLNRVDGEEEVGGVGRARRDLAPFGD